MKRVFLSLLFVVTALQVFADDLSASVTNASYGISDGLIVLNVVNGIAPYTFSWTGPDGFISNEKDISDLEPGEYCVVVNDFFCGVAELCIIVGEEEPEVLISDHSNVPLYIYPNPFGRELHVSLFTAAEHTYIFKFSDMAGREIYSSVYFLQAGMNELLLQFKTELPAGDLILSISDEKEAAISKQILHLE